MPATTRPTMPTAAAPRPQQEQAPDGHPPGAEAQNWRSSSLRQDFLLGDWLVEPSACRIGRDGMQVHLRARLMDVLVRLAACPGEVVLKDDLIADVWELPFLAESVLTRSITELRQALCDDPHTPRYIETITKRGYRLVAAIERVHHPSAGRAVVERERDAPGSWQDGSPPGSAIVIEHVPATPEPRRDTGRVPRIVISAGRIWIEDLGRDGLELAPTGAGSRRTEPSDEYAVAIGPITLVFHRSARDPLDDDPPERPRRH